ncbi:MAG: GMC family oxidoreductase [Pseudomonadota bacterium]
MFLDAAALSQAEPPKADLCIIGAGAAGLAMAWHLRDSPLRVVLLESGGTTQNPAAPDASASALNAGLSNHSDYPFETSRARGFGGTTALWTGACVPLDADDFEERDWVPYSGWPIGPKDLARYYLLSEPIFGMVDPEPHLASLKMSPFNGGAMAARFAQITRQGQFAPRFMPMVAGSDRLTCILGATVTGFEVAEGGRTVIGVRIRDGAANQHILSARATVIATGGIEAPRLLLSEVRQIGAAMGPAANVIGRYHMEHPIRSLGVVRVPNATECMTAFTNLKETGHVALQGIFGLNRETRQRERLLNTHFRVYRFHALENDPAIVRLKNLARREEPIVGAIARASILSDFAKCATYGAWHIWNKSSRNAWFDHVRLQGFVEQEPDPNNRITLSDQTDRYGQPLPQLALNESALMKDSLSRTLDIVASSLAERGLTDVQLGEDQVRHLEHYGGYGLHHMGGTRMSAEPSNGVVDADCRIHGMANLFVASSSVFPTGGAANPTLTICALALRLADHLANMLKPR